MATLEKFKQAQALDFERAVAELRAGQKTSHWIWYVFPQLTVLGRSAMSRSFGIRDLREACDYLRDPLLCEHYVLATRAVAEQVSRGVKLTMLMGSTIDVLKLVSSLTLFQSAVHQLSEEEPDEIWEQMDRLIREVLAAARAQGYDRCGLTDDELFNRRIAG